VVVPSGDADALSTAMSRLARDRAGAVAIGRRGMEHVAAHFAVPRSATAVAALYRALVDGADGSAGSHEVEPAPA
jgi:hypothetical protein